MAAPGIVPAEEAVEALIASLVSPFLPRRSVPCNSLSLELQEIVAKQMHAVVLLYNYYYRKLYRKLDFLDFSSFCKIACISNYSLLKFMNAISKSNTSSGDLYEPLSVTERMIMDACNIASALDASKDTPNMEGWPITKVAIFLVDSSKKHCLLRSNGSTHATKSLIEKNLETSLANVASETEDKNLIRANINGSGFLEERFIGMENILQDVAFSAINEETGISQSNLIILECYLSYSLTHAKSCTWLYIMSYSDSIVNQIPIESVIQSLQEPLVKINSAPIVTKAIEYFSLLPYIDILSNWFSGNASHSVLQQTGVVKNGTEGISTTDIHEVNDDVGRIHKIMNNCSSLTNANNKTARKNENYLSIEDMSATYQNTATCLTKNADMEDFSVLTEQNCDILMSKKRKIVSAVSPVACHHYHVDDSFTLDGDRLETENRLNLAVGTKNDMIVSLKHPNDKHDTTVVCPKKVGIISALQMLKKRRDELCQRQRLLDDNIARCEMMIQTIVSGCSESRVEFMLKACESLCSNELKHCNDFNHEAQDQQQHRLSSRKLCEAVLCLHTPCQELDEIICTNNWMLPKYCMLPSTDGKYQAGVSVRGMDFECNVNGEWETSPNRARDSAATYMLRRLRIMAIDNIHAVPDKS